MSNEEIIKIIRERRLVAAVQQRVAVIRRGMPPSKQTVYDCWTNRTLNDQLVFRAAKQIAAEYGIDITGDYEEQSLLVAA